MTPQPDETLPSRTGRVRPGRLGTRRTGNTEMTSPRSVRSEGQTLGRGLGSRGQAGPPVRASAACPPLPWAAPASLRWSSPGAFPLRFSVRKCSSPCPLAQLVLFFKVNVCQGLFLLPPSPPPFLYSLSGWHTQHHSKHLPSRNSRSRRSPCVRHAWQLLQAPVQPPQTDSPWPHSTCIPRPGEAPSLPVCLVPLLQ